MSARRAPKLPGSNKQRLCRDIARVIGRPVRVVSTGATEPKQTFVDVVESLNLPISTELRKPWLGQAIAEFAGLHWNRSFDSRHTPSGGGDNVKVAGLECLLRAAELLRTRDIKPLAVQAALAPGAKVSRIRLRPVAANRSRALAESAFAERTDPRRQRLLLEKALAGHHELLAALIRHFRNAGYKCFEDPRSVDLIAEGQYLTVLIEVKTVPGSAIDVVRSGLSQLFEYAYRLRRDLPNPVLVLAIDRPVRSPRWLVPYVTQDRRVNIVWRNGTRMLVEGPDAPSLRRVLRQSED